MFFVRSFRLRLSSAFRAATEGSGREHRRFRLSVRVMTHLPGLSETWDEGFRTLRKNLSQPVVPITIRLVKVLTDVIPGKSFI